MTQPSRTTESISRDNAAMREIMLQIRQLTVPDRATLAVGLIGHLATLMNRSQLSKLMAELQEEATRVQDVPPTRQHERPAERVGSEGADSEQSGATATPRADSEQTGATTPRADPQAASATRSDRNDERDSAGLRSRSHEGVGQAGRGEFRSRELL